MSPLQIVTAGISRASIVLVGLVLFSMVAERSSQTKILEAYYDTNYYPIRRATEGRTLSASQYKYFAGIDGGASKTLCLISDEDGKILGFGRAGPSNYHNIGLGAALSNLKLSLESACDDANVQARDVDMLCFGLAGLDSPSDERGLSRAIKMARFAMPHLMVNDSQMAVAAALAGRPGVIVNAGTGSVAGGINSKGKMAKVGGWGNIIDDEGSGYAIGRKGLQACMRAFDGRGPQSRLLSLVIDRFGLNSVPDIVESVYVRRMTVAEMAGVSSLVDEAAEQGDMVARSILEEAGRELAKMAVTTARVLSLSRTRYDVAVVGSVFSSMIVSEAFETNLHALSPSARIISPAFPQVFGSVILAMRKGGIETSAIIMSNLASGKKRLPRSVTTEPGLFRRARRV